MSSNVLSQPVSTSDRLQHVAQRIRVPSGFVLSGLYLYFARPSLLVVVIGGAISLLGLLTRAWASGHLRKNETLATSGPYALTRNPLYLGSFLMGIGCAVAGGNLWVALGLIAFFLMIYLPVMQAEARHLTQIFPDDYPVYARQVPLLLPKLTALPAALQSPFNLQLYLRYREYRAALGLFSVFAFLVVRMYGKF